MTTTTQTQAEYLAEILNAYTGDDWAGLTYGFVDEVGSAT